MSTTGQDLVITGAAAATAGAYGIEAHWDLLSKGVRKAEPAAYSMRDFKAAPYLSDKRMLKAVSASDAIGLAALEGLVKAAAFRPGVYPATRVGLYVGAPPASVFDNEPYLEALDAARGPNGEASEREFGRTFGGSRPTTLLVGLPNNVLCYGALLLDARGPNSNYTASGLSGHLAVINGARRVRRGALDLAVAGGFSAHTDDIHRRLFARLGLIRSPQTPDGTVLADGGAFVAIETRAAAKARGAKVLATYLAGQVASDALGPTTIDERGDALAAAIRRALVEAGIGPASIGLVLASATGIGRLDRCEFSVLSRVFANEREFPALGTSTTVLGNLIEAAGVLELGLIPYLFAGGDLPQAMRAAPAGSAFGHRWHPERPHVMILRTTPWGEYSCVIARGEPPCP